MKTKMVKIEGAMDMVHCCWIWSELNREAEQWSRMELKNQMQVQNYTQEGFRVQSIFSSSEF